MKLIDLRKKVTVSLQSLNLKAIFYLDVILVEEFVSCLKLIFVHIFLRFTEDKITLILLFEITVSATYPNLSSASRRLTKF